MTLDVSQASFENKQDFKSWGAADFVPADRFPKTMDTLCKEISKLK